MKSVELVVHCWARLHSFYAAALNYQLSSLVLYPAKSTVSVAVCCTPEDELTLAVIEYFRNRHQVPIRSVVLSIPEIGRRAIGRNKAAKTTESDFVWFTDADVFFEGTAFDTLVHADWPKDVSLAFPNHFRWDVSIRKGNRILKQWSGVPQVISVNT